MEALEHIDREIFLFLNGLNAAWADPIMKVFTSHAFWVPFVVLIAILVILKYRKKAWIPLIIIALCFASTDRISSMTKNRVCRYRPTHNVEIADSVHIVDGYRGGQYGFFSSHAANSFGLALLSLLILKNKKFTIFILAWAVIVSYSRIYVGVHYPADIAVGAAAGCLIATAFYLIFNKLRKKFIPKS